MNRQPISRPVYPFSSSLKSVATVTNRYLHFFSTASMWHQLRSHKVWVDHFGLLQCRDAPLCTWFLFSLYMNLLIIKNIHTVVQSAAKNQLGHPLLSETIYRFKNVDNSFSCFFVFFFFTLRFAKCPTASQRNRYSPAHPMCYYGLQKSNLISHVDFSL